MKVLSIDVYRDGSVYSWDLLDDFKVADKTTLMFARAQTSKAEEADLAAPSKTLGLPS